MPITISYKKDGLWRSVCSVCKSWMDLDQVGNPCKLHALMIKNHKYCGQGWDKQFNK